MVKSNDFLLNDVLKLITVVNFIFITPFPRAMKPIGTLKLYYLRRAC